MLNNYLKTAVRNLSGNRSHFFLNITGLIVGFSAFLLIFLVLEYEQSFDSFHAKKDRIYRVVREGRNPASREYRAGVPFPVAEGLRADYPQLENAAAIWGDYGVQVIIPGPGGETLKKFKEKTGVCFTEPRFFEIFDFKMVTGNAANALREPNTALLTRDLAVKYFGDWTTATGKIIKAYGRDIRITGILENPPGNTDFPLGLVLSYTTLDVNMNDWTSISDENYCFVQLRPGASSQQFSKLLPAFISKHIPPENAGYDLKLQPLGEMHFDKRFGNLYGRTFGRDLIAALSLVGIFLLIIACVNFINLSTANAINRAREVGVRKALGSSRRQLLVQFFGETGLTCLIALASAVIIAFICLPPLDKLLEIKMSVSMLWSPAILGTMLLSLGLVTLLSGLYPALILSGFNPVHALKSRVMAEKGKGISLRRGLVVLQFVIAQILITGTLVVIAQMRYFRNVDMGFNQEAVINAGIPRDSLSMTKTDLLKEQLLRVPGIRSVSFSAFTPATDGVWATSMYLSTNHSKNADLIVNMKTADTGYFNIYQLQLAAGRVYFQADTVGELVVNETLLKEAGLGSPEAAIGKQIRVLGVTRPIVGVVKDFHVKSLRDPIDAVVMTTRKSSYGLANIKIEPGKAKQAIAAMEAVWNSIFPDYVFEYNFVDQSIASYYKQEDQLSQLFKIFAGVAIAISCLGLYGLVSFVAARRKKEIGIRKVLGARAGNILFLLSREFTVLIAIAFLVASPVAWYVMNEWLQQYTFRINIGAGFFIATFLSSILIAWLTVGHSAIKAAIANPVKSLRAE